MVKRVTKKEKRAYDAAEWRRALADGRVVSYNKGMTMTSHPTKQGAEDHFLALLPNDDSAKIVQVAP